MRMRHLLRAAGALAAIAVSTAALPQAATQSGTVTGGSSNFLWGMYQVGSQNNRPVLVPRMILVDTLGNPITNFGGGGSSGGSSGPQGPAGTSNSTAAYVQGVTNGVPFPVTGSFLQDTTFTTRIPTNGQKAKAGSIPVTIASDQDTLTVAIASNVLAANAATASGQATGNASLSSIDTKTPALVNGKVPIDGTVLADLRVAGALNTSSNPIFAQITNFPTNQTVNGTVTANLGTLNGAALDATSQGIATSNTAIANATGTAADAATASGANTTLIGAMRAVRDRLLGTVNVVIGAGSATIGAVTQAGTWAVNSTLQAGSAIIGKVGIDQTTPGVTNGIVQTPNAAISVQRTGSIGTTAVQVSAADANNRRTVTNTSTLACELMGSSTAYGTGYPLPAGQSFTFDASGRTTAALFVACSASGGSVAVLSF